MKINTIGLYVALIVVVLGVLLFAQTAEAKGSYSPNEDRYQTGSPALDACDDDVTYFEEHPCYKEPAPSRVAEHKSIDAPSIQKEKPEVKDEDRRAELIRIINLLKTLIALMQERQS